MAEMRIKKQVKQQREIAQLELLLSIEETARAIRLREPTVKEERETLACLVRAYDALSGSERMQRETNFCGITMENAKYIASLRGPTIPGVQR